MSATPVEPDARVETALADVERLIAAVPGGASALLGRRVLVLQAGASVVPAVLLACHGARVDVSGLVLERWDPDVHPALLARLRERFARERRDLDPRPLDALLDAGFFATERLRTLGGGVDGVPAGEPYDLVLTLEWLTTLERPDVALARLFGLARAGAPVLHRTERPEAFADGLRAAGFDVKAEPPEGWVATSRRRGVNTEYPVETDSPATLAHSRARYAFVESFVEGKRVLDLGCGAGLGTRQLTDAGAALACGVDRREEALAAAVGARDDSVVAWARADATRALPFAADVFDVVVALEILEHVDAQQELVDEVRRVLRPDGVAIVSIPNPPFEHLWEKLNGESNPFHVRVPYYDELVTLLWAFPWVEFYGQTDVVASVVLPLDDRDGRETTGTVRLPAATALRDHGTSTIVAVCRSERRAPDERAAPRACAFGDYQDEVQGAVVARHDLERRLREHAWREFAAENRERWDRG